MTKREQVLEAFTVEDLKNPVTLASIQLALMVADELEVIAPIKQVINSN